MRTVQSPKTKTSTSVGPQRPRQIGSSSIRMIPRWKARSPMMRPRRSCGVLAEARQEIWHQNMLYIMSENDKTLLYSLGMTQFADLTQAHWRELSQWIMDGQRKCRSSSSWIVTRSIPFATVGSWTTASISPRRMPCARRPVAVTTQ